MKKNSLLFLLIVLSTIDLFGQISAGNLVITLDGNYIKSKVENGVTTNYDITKGQYLYVVPSIGFFLTDRFLVGAGLDCVWEKETRQSALNFNNFYQKEEMKTTSKAFLPNIYLGYYFPIFNKLYFNTNLKFSFGKIKSDYQTNCTGTTISTSIYSISDTIPSYHRTDSQKTDFDYFSSQINPELNYFISSKFSLCLGLGGIEYSILDGKSENSAWAVNFNPIYWRLGIKFKI
jgi:hypothetical protein